METRKHGDNARGYGGGGLVGLDVGGLAHQRVDHEVGGVGFYDLGGLGLADYVGLGVR